MDAKHTKLPWIQGATLATCIFVPDKKTQIGEMKTEANAEFIVRACNSHYELLDIIKRCQDKLATYIVPDSGITDHEVVNELLGILDGKVEIAVIRKAEASNVTN